MSTNHVISHDNTPSPYRYEPQDIASALRFADAVVRSGLTPHIRSKEQAFVLLATGAELGLTAMQSLRAIHVIDGKPCLSSDLIVGLVKRSPVCEWFRLVESSREIAVYETQRRGEPKPTRYTYSVEDAKRAGLLGKRNWRLHPGAMLRARCASALARAVYPDLVAGVYDPEELENTHERRPSRASKGHEASARREQKRSNGHGNNGHGKTSPRAEAAPQPSAKSEPRPTRSGPELEVIERPDLKNAKLPGADQPKPAEAAAEEPAARTAPATEEAAPTREAKPADAVEAKEVEAVEAQPEVATKPEAEGEEEHSAADEAQAASEEADEEHVDSEPEASRDDDPLITLPGIGKALNARLKEAGVYSLEQFVAFCEGDAWEEINGFHDRTRQRSLTAARQRLSELEPEAEPAEVSEEAEAETSEAPETPENEHPEKLAELADMSLREAAKHIAKQLVRAGLYRKGDNAMQALAAQVQELGVKPTESTLAHLAEAWARVESSHQF